MKVSNGPYPMSVMLVFTHLRVLCIWKTFYMTLLYQTAYSVSINFTYIIKLLWASRSISFLWNMIKFQERTPLRQVWQSCTVWSILQLASVQLVTYLNWIYLFLNWNIQCHVLIPFGSTFYSLNHWGWIECVCVEHLSITSITCT